MYYYFNGVDNKEEKQDMAINMQTAVMQLRIVIITAALVGAIGGWAGVFLEDEAATASLCAKFYYALYIVIPVVLFVTERITRSRKRPGVTIGGKDRIFTGLTAGIIGSLVGALMFVILSIALPTVFGGKEWGMIQDELFKQIGLLKILYLVIITILAATGTGFLSRKNGS